jgi:DNA-directed RNA polymerase I, II, and III subunit RPABC1
MNTQSQLEKLFMLKKTQIELTRDRGFDIKNDEKMLTWSLSAFVRHLSKGGQRPRDILTTDYESTFDDDRRLLAYYGTKDANMKHVSVEEIRLFRLKISELNITDAILIVDAPISTTANDHLNKITNVNWQIFNDSELHYNPTTHISVPKHILLSPEEAEAKQKELKVTPLQLPIMHNTDPIIKYYGWQVGNIVKIYRNDTFINIPAPHSINYKIIIDNKIS